MPADRDKDVERMPPAGRPDVERDVQLDAEALDRETQWQLVGCIILLVIAVLMAIAVKLSVP